MEPNVDRGMWAIVALLVAVVIGGAVMLIFPNFVGQIGNEMTELMTNPSMIINKGKTGENVGLDTDDDSSGSTDESVVLPTVPDGYVLATDSMFSGDKDGEFRYIGRKPYITIPHIIKGVPVTSYVNMFRNNGVIKGVASNNTSVTNIESMFHNSSATSLDLSSFDTSSVTNMNYMFFNSAATEIDLSNFDTSNATNMGSMFNGSRATTLDLSSFNTSNVTNMAYMFRGSSATSLDLSSFDTSSVTRMGYMFYESAATELDLSSFDTSNVTDMGSMFSSSHVTILDLSSFNTSNVTEMDFMFYNIPATVGYARIQADADKFNASSNKPAGLTFTEK